MELDRRVQIRVAKAGGGGKGFGSGYLLAPRLVLTADHVLDGMDPNGGVQALTVCQPDAGPGQFPAVVRWRRRDGAVDAALVEVVNDGGWPVPESLVDLVSRPPQRFGLLIGTRPVQVTVPGFPRAQKDPDDGRRLDEVLPGRIVPGSGALAGRYEISSTEPVLPFQPGPGGGSAWSGVSGAPVLAEDGFGGDLLCGVVRADRRADGGTRLSATPAPVLLADPAFRAVVDEHGRWEPAVEPVEPASLFKPAAYDRDLNSPAALLRADTEAVGFYGRTAELEALHTWCMTGPSRVTVHVVTGPGGQGKTRLGRRLTDQLSWQGWVTGHLRSDLTDHDDPPDFTVLATAMPLLLVLDYAETRPYLLRRLLAHLARSQHRCRVLLLARADGEWRTDTLEAVPAVRALLAAAPVLPLAPLVPASGPAGQRLAMFQAAAADLAQLLPAVPTVPAHPWQLLASGLKPSDDLDHPRYDNALTLQMAALVTLLQRGPDPVQVAEGAPGEEVLLQHEQRFWKASADTPAFALGLSTRTLKQTVAVAALCGAASADEAQRTLVQVPGLPADKVPDAAAWLAGLYPADPDRYWGSLQPDRIAEYHASRTLTSGEISLPTLLAASAPAQQAQAITVLARATIAHYNAGRATDADRVLHTLNHALDTTTLPRQGIRSTAVALPHPSRIIASLALRLAEDLVVANRQLAADDPTTHEPELARSLAHLGNQLSETGRSMEALEATQQAVQIYERLAVGNPAAYEPDLAASLSNLGNRLTGVGQRGEALEAAQRAAQIHMRLANSDPATYIADFARSLTNLGVQLSQAGRHEDALEATQQAVDIYKWLAGSNPAIYEPDLAASLSNLGIRFSKAGRHEDALEATQQAVEIYKPLAASNSAAYEADLARSLTNLGAQLSQAGRRGEALEATQQAVEIYKPLAAGNPAAYEADLAASLTNLGTWLSQADRYGEALAATQQVIHFQRRLAAGNPAAYEPDLANSLSLSALLLTAEGDYPGALAVTSEAVECYQHHTALMPALMTRLHTTLRLQALLLDRLGHSRDAEAIRRWLSDNPRLDASSGE
ncbi:tetratricopeptide (TPR) repeat protein [Catenulispora sp. GAS73]|uniref:tetratricopeptide repeat protein n=1 Tax=Catenulispora sp. GAS73 TaxID=3156269 RepID=UPI003513B0EC